MKRANLGKRGGKKNQLFFEDLFTDDEDCTGSSYGSTLRSASCAAVAVVGGDRHSAADREPRISPPRTEAQRAYHVALQGPSSIVVCCGPAGSGKTLSACEYAVKWLEDGRFRRVILVRPAVSTEDLGYLPGTVLEKLDPYLRPMYDVFEAFYEKKQFAALIERGVVEPCALAYCRGRTFKHALVIADEMQNATPEQLKMLITRLGTGSKLVVTGDLRQHDQAYGKVNGLHDFIERWEAYSAQREDAPLIEIVRFARADIQRHPVLEHVLRAYEDGPAGVGVGL